MFIKRNTVLINTSIWSIILVIVSSLVGVVSQKLYAVFTGYEGLVAIGNFNNFSSIAYILASGGIFSGIVKVVASEEKKNERELIKKIFTILLFYSIITSFLLILINTWIHKLVFPEIKISHWLNILFFLCLPFITFTNGILYVLNGQKEIKKYSLFTILINLINLILTALLVVNFKINGAIISLFLPMTLSFVIIKIYSKNAFFWPSFRFKTILKSKIYRTLLGFSVVTILSMFLLSLNQLTVRKIILDNYTIQNTGEWQMLLNFSRIWMAVIIGVLSMYFFPRISSKNDKKDVKKEVNIILQFILPAVILVFSVIYYFRIFLITTIYTEEFINASEYFIYQIIGDVIKSIALIFSFFLLAKSKLKYYAFCEIMFSLSYITLSYQLIDFYSLSGVYLSYILSNALYLILLLFYYLRYIKH